MAVIVALFLVVLLVIGALVLDLGSLYDHDRELQSAADAGVLAGAQELFWSDGSIAAAEGQTRSYVSKNSAPNSSVVAANTLYELLNIDARSVEVRLRENGVPFSFARVIGKTEGSVTAYAKAELMYLTGINGLFPIALPYVHPHHFKIVYANGGSDVLTNEESGQSSDVGIYDSEPTTASFDFSSGPHSVSVIAQDEGNNDLLTWSDIGSIYVPPAGSAIRSVEVLRNTVVPGDATANLGETLTVRIRTSDEVTDPKVGVQIQIANKKYKLDLGGDGSGFYEGSRTLPTPAFTNGIARVTITTEAPNKNSLFPDGVDIGAYTWYERGFVLVYASFNSESVAGGNTSVTAEVMTKVFKFETPIMIKPALDSEGTYQGNDFWANVIVGQILKTELEVAFGIQPMGDGWKYEPDVGSMADDPGTLRNGYIDIGEYLPYDNGVSVGHWNWVDGWYESAPKPVIIYLPIVDPGSKKDGWRIQGFAAFQIEDWGDSGNRLSMTGRFVEWLAGGPWSPNKPNGLYVWTAVLTK